MPAKPPPLTTAPLMFFDLETTSAEWFREVWNVGAIIRNPDGTERDRHDLIISDVDVTRANPFSLEIGHFHERHPAVGGDPGDAEVVTAAEAARRISQWTRRTVNGHRVHVIGVVPNFDTEASQLLLRRHNCWWDAHYHLLDVANLALGFLLGSGFFADWETFLADVARGLPDGTLTREHRERLAAGDPILNGAAEPAEFLASLHYDIPRLARAVGHPIYDGPARIDPLPYLLPDPPWSSVDLAEALGVEPIPRDLRHTALADAEWAARFWDRMMERAPAALRTSLPLTVDPVPVA